VNILIGCEFSGRVREAFRARGHDVWSCDLLPTEITGQHFEVDVRTIINYHSQWDMLIAFPPCTHLAVSGNRWYAGSPERARAVAFVEELWNCYIPRIAIENPVGVLSTQSSLGKPAQYVQPWQFGHGYTKKTGLWLKGLPALVPTNVVSGRDPKIWRMGESKARQRARNLTPSGLALAMAEQWG